MTRLMACPPTCGAAAAVLVLRGVRAAPRASTRPSSIAAQAMTTDTPDTFAAHDMMELVGYDMAKAAARQVYEAAGIGPEDVDVVELHDCFAQNELISYEALGLCPEGGGEKFVADGDNTYGGRYVTNPSGGLLSKGHPLGATGPRAVLRAHAAAARTAPAARQVEGAQDRPAAQPRAGRRLRRHALSRGLTGASGFALIDRSHIGKEIGRTPPTSKRAGCACSRRRPARRAPNTSTTPPRARPGIRRCPRRRRSRCASTSRCPIRSRGSPRWASTSRACCTAASGSATSRRSMPATG